MRRVVVTGLGLVTPLGVGVPATWAGLTAGKSGIRRITHFDAADYPSQIAGEVPPAGEPNGFNPDDFIPAKDQKKMDRFIQLGMAAAQEAVHMAGLENIAENAELSERIGVVLGSGIGGLPEVERTVQTLLEKGPKRVSPFYIPAILGNLLAGQVAIRYGFKGPNDCTVTACATGSHAIGTAMRLIQYGEADAVLAGGAESAICPTSLAGFAAAKALSTHFNDTPEKACRPFDKDRDGFIIAEGAGVLMLEEYEHAKARGATILAELAGFGQTADAYHITMPAPDGNGGRRAMQAALKDANLKPEDVGYVNAHATSTPAGDELESKSIEAVFGKDVLVSGIKSMTGHMLGAAGGVEAAVCVLTLMHQTVPPTINLENPSEGCTLDYVPNTARQVKLNAVLSNSFGFGGTNASLLFKKL